MKTSLAPGSRVVTDYFTKAGVLDDLAALGFDLVGYGCTTCIAAGTPVLLANGTSRRIERMPAAGGVRLFGPTADGRLGLAAQGQMMVQGERECVSVVLQDGRRLLCTPDHKILCADGRWVEAGELIRGRDRVVMGLEAPLDEPRTDEAGYELPAGELKFSLADEYERARTLAFARLVGHLISDGSISVLGQGRMNVGQALDRQAVLDDIELLTGKRPAAKRYDARKWAIVLPRGLTAAVASLAGVRIGQRIHQPPALPRFVLQPECPLAVVREFLGGLFGADGHAPVLKRQGASEHGAIVRPPAYSQTAKPEHVEQLKEVMQQIIRLLVRCGVKARGAQVYTYRTRRSPSSYPAGRDGAPRLEVRLVLREGLSFVERVGFRYCVDKSLRASAAAVYWRTIDTINRQRLWMADRIEALNQNYGFSFQQTRRIAAAELMTHETALFPRYALLEGHDRFDRLPDIAGPRFKPLHRDSCNFPSPVELFRQIGAREWFARLEPRETADGTKRYCLGKDALTLPTFYLQVADVRPAGRHLVFDLSVEGLHAFVAGNVAVHNCIGNCGPLKPEISAAVKAGRYHGLRGALRQPQLRGPRASRSADELPRLPAAGRGVRAGRHARYRSHQRAARHRQGRQARVPGRHLAERRGSAGAAPAAPSTPRCSATATPASSMARATGASIKVPAGQRYTWDAKSTYVKNPPYFEGMTMTPAPLADVSGARALARARRLGHDRSHLARGQHLQEQPGGPLSHRAGRAARRFQLLRRAPRQS